MAEGFCLELRDYCSYCGDFEPDITKMEMQELVEESSRYITVIRCANANKCARINENMRRRLK